jgi:hypothetical protein
VLSNSAQAFGLATLFTNQLQAWRGAILQASPSMNLPTASDAGAVRHSFKALVTTESGLGNVPALTKYQGTAPPRVCPWAISFISTHRMNSSPNVLNATAFKRYCFFIFDE